MKTIYLLFAVACLAFHVQANPKPQPEDVPQNAPENLDVVEDDGIRMEDAEIAEDPDAQGNPIVCLFSGGVCRHSCASNEGIYGVCSTNIVCCVKKT